MEYVLKFCIGQKVVFKNLIDLHGIVTAVCLRHGGYITYEVSWFKEMESKSGWFIEDELVSEEFAGYCKIGFKK